MNNDDLMERLEAVFKLFDSLNLTYQAGFNARRSALSDKYEVLLSDISTKAYAIFNSMSKREVIDIFLRDRDFYVTDFYSLFKKTIDDPTLSLRANDLTNFIKINFFYSEYHKRFKARVVVDHYNLSKYLFKNLATNKSALDHLLEMISPGWIISSKFISEENYASSYSRALLESAFKCIDHKKIERVLINDLAPIVKRISASKIYA